MQSLTGLRNKYFKKYKHRSHLPPYISGCICTLWEAKAKWLSKNFSRTACLSKMKYMSFFFLASKPDVNFPFASLQQKKYSLFQISQKKSRFRKVTSLSMQPRLFLFVTYMALFWNLWQSLDLIETRNLSLYSSSVFLNFTLLLESAEEPKSKVLEERCSVKVNKTNYVTIASNVMYSYGDTKWRIYFFWNKARTFSYN